MHEIAYLVYYLHTHVDNDQTECQQNVPGQLPRGVEGEGGGALSRISLSDIILF